VVERGGRFKHQFKRQIVEVTLKPGASAMLNAR
jgi:hypothetical protein